MSTHRRIALHRLVTTSAALVLAVLLAPLAHAVDVELAWDPPTENADGSPLTDLAGYRVYQGDSTGTYTVSTDVGNQTTHTLTGLQQGQVYFFATTAYDTSDNESDFSEELQWSMTAPEATADAYSLSEDGSLTRNAGAGVLANDSDFEDDTLSAVLVSDVAQGTLSLNADGSFVYTPNPNFSGSDSFTYRAADSSLQSDPVTVTLTVTPVNDAPEAGDFAVAATEDTPSPLTLTGSDIDGDSLTYTVLTGPAHGALSGTAPNLTYTPAANYYGSDTVTFRVNDGTVNSEVATVSITVDPVNDAPQADPLVVEVLEDGLLHITLSGSDIDGDSLTYVVVTQPGHGTLSGTAPNLVFTPNPDYSGSDLFRYRVNDGTANSPSVTVTINVLAVDDTPPAPPGGLRVEVL